MTEKYSIDEKSHLATEKNFVTLHFLKINNQGGPNKLWGGSEKNQKIKHPFLSLSCCKNCEHNPKFYWLHENDANVFFVDDSMSTFKLILGGENIKIELTSGKAHQLLVEKMLKSAG